MKTKGKRRKEAETFGNSKEGGRCISEEIHLYLLSEDLQIASTPLGEEEIKSQ